MGVVATAGSLAQTVAPVSDTILQDDAVGANVVNAVLQALASRYLYALVGTGQRRGWGRYGCVGGCRGGWMCVCVDSGCMIG